MARTETGAVKGESLEVRRTYSAPREKIFRAWTDPKKVMQWFPPQGEYEAAATTIDLRPGGSYRWGLRKLPDGEPFWSVGTFLEIDPPRKLVYTWRWSSASESEDTIVTVEFHERGGGTELIIRHDRFASKDMRNQHEQGWQHCLVQLEEFINKEEKK
jgi:uncharacterized protein YndB with AHSA1/START domain